MKIFKKIFLPLLLGLVGFLVWYASFRLNTSGYLSFSDAAKFADIGRNLSLGDGFQTGFSFFGKENPLEMSGPLFSAMGMPPFYPFILALAFQVFGISDMVVVATSGFFYILSAVALYWLGKKIFGSWVGVLASLVFIFDPAMINLAVTGASESLFIFELITAALLFWQNSRLSLSLGFLTLLLLYLTRSSGIIYVLAFLLFFVLKNFQGRKKLLKVLGILFLVWMVLEVAAFKLTDRTLVYSPLLRFLDNVAIFSPSTTPTSYFRGGEKALTGGLKPFLSKVFYDLYNLYKLLPGILSPYLAGLYLLSLLRRDKEKEKNVFRLIVLFMVLLTFLATAATLPIFRYLAPLIPFIYLLAVEMLVWIVAKAVNRPSLAFVFVLLFIIGQTLGQIFLDSRFLAKITNRGKPPINYVLGKMVGDESKPGDLVVTNLDTWGSWYGERKTVWLPLSPEQLISQTGEKTRVDVIFLTSYLAEDASAKLGSEWRSLLEAPENQPDSFMGENFYLVKKFKINPQDNYNRETVSGVILKKRP